MKLSPPPTGFGRLSGSFRRAFSLIEIMVTVGLLSFIVLGLVAMFSQTQRAFMSSMGQVDVLEAGRAVTEMLSRELAETTPSHRPFVTNFFAEVDVQNFADPLLQHMPGGTHNRTNIIQRFYLLSRHNMEWTGVGYEVLPLQANSGVGTLVRYASPPVDGRTVHLLSSNYLAAHNLGVVTNRVADGIVHLRLVPYDASGVAITRFWPTNSAMLEKTIRSQNLYIPDQYDVYFTSNAIPAYLELELGILDPQVLERYKAAGGGNPVIQRQFLSNRVAQVHLFRQRIPLRNADLSVYP